MTANVTRDSTRPFRVRPSPGPDLRPCIYLLATLAMLLLFSSAIAAKSGAPFADAIAPILGASSGSARGRHRRGQRLRDCNACCSSAAEIARTMGQARDLPALFTRSQRVSVRQSAHFHLRRSLRHCSSRTARRRTSSAVYIFITLVSTLLRCVLYMVCAAAALKLGVCGKADDHRALSASAYSIAMFVGAGSKPSCGASALARPACPSALSRVG